MEEMTIQDEIDLLEAEIAAKKKRIEELKNQQTNG